MTALTLLNYGAVDLGIGSLASVSELKARAANVNNFVNFIGFLNDIFY